MKFVNETDNSNMQMNIQRQIYVVDVLSDVSYFNHLSDSDITMNQLRDEVREQVRECELTNFEYDFFESDFCALSSSLFFILAFILLSFEKSSDTLRSLSKSKRIVLALNAYSKRNKSLHVTTQSYDVCRNTLRNRIDEKRSFEEYEMNRRLLQS